MNASNIMSVYALSLVLGSTAFASDMEALRGLDFSSLPTPPGMDLAQLKKDGLASPQDIQNAFQQCQGKGPGCVSQVLKSEGFKVPEVPAGAQQLTDCLDTAATNGNKPADVKACFDQYGPKGGPLPAVPDSSATATSTGTDTSTSTDTSTTSSTSTSTSGSTSSSAL